MGSNEINERVMLAIGKIQGELEGINGNIANIQKGNMPLCATHTEALRSIHTKLDRIERKGNSQSASDDGGKWAFQFGRLRAAGMPAIIIAALIGAAIFTYIQTKTMKEETIQTARDLAAETKSETLNILRQIRHSSEKPVGEMTMTKRDNQ